jgi:uncharacterized protein
MKVSGSATLATDRGTVWQALNDPAVLVRCLPGCQRLQALGDDRYAMTVSAGVGAIKGVYDGQVSLTDQQEPGSFRMHAQGAGAAGTIQADVHVTLEEGQDGGTALTYDADAVVGGMIGGVGQRMLTGVSKRMAAEFFANVDAALAATDRTRDRTSPADRDGDGGAPVAGPGGRPSGARPDGSGAPPSPARAAGRTPGAVFEPPPSPLTEQRTFAAGVGVGAAAALVGALVGAWISRRAGGRGQG